MIFCIVCYSVLHYAPAVGGVKRYRDPSVCVSHGAAALGAQLPKDIGTLAACSLAMCGLRTRPRTDVDPPRVELPSPGAYRLAAPGTITCLKQMRNATW